MSKTTRERRRGAPLDPDALREGLLPAQLKALATLEQFGWTLKFVRRPMFLEPVPVAFNRDGDRWVVIEPDGSLNENPGFKIRD